MDDARQRRETIIGAVGIVLVVLVSGWIRAPGFTQGGFASHDVAGILYNAMVLHDGGLPYVDTIEIKAPGTFYLATLLAGPDGTDIARFQSWANVWALLSLIAVAAIGWRAWGPLAGLVAAIAYALVDANLDSMDANYVTWANLPQILAIGAALEAMRASGRHRAGWWVLAGLMCGAAALCKRPDGIVLLVVLVFATWPTMERRPRLRDALWVGTGLGLAHVPIIIDYAGQGQVDALIDGYVLNRWGLRYVAARSEDSAVAEGLLAAAYFVGLLLIPAAFSIGRARREQWRGPLAVFVVWAGATLIAASVGARFYKGYFLASAAPLALLAAAPWGLMGARPFRPRVARFVALIPVLVLGYRSTLQLEHMRRDRARAHDTGGRQIAEHMLEHTDPDDTIWVWGWHLWDVYPLADRRSASRIYKSLGLLTPPNDDTWRRPASKLTFVDSEYAQLLLGELDENRPRYIVLGSTVPRGEFEALRDFLRQNYRRDRSRRVGRVEFWKRREPRQTGSR